MSQPTPEQLAKINQLAKKPLSPDQVYVFRSKMIGDKLIPQRHMRVTPNFLQKMAQQTKDGVALMIDHPWKGGFLSPSQKMAVPVGRTFDAVLQNEPDGELALYGDHYIVRGRTAANGMSTDDIINAIDDGTMFDTSVGYGATNNLCSIDGLDYFGGVCPHIAGETYDGQVAHVNQDDGYLMENSLVFDGAYPTAGVVAASRTGVHPHEQEPGALVLTEDDKVLKNAERVLFTFSAKHGLHSYAQAKGSEKTVVALGVIPPDVSDKLAPKDTPWHAPTLSDFTMKSWDNLTDSEKRHIAGYYAWAKEMPPATFGDLKLPHHRASDGDVVWHGVVAAAQRINQVDIPEEDLPKVKAQLAHHYHQWGERAPWEDGGSTNNHSSQSKGVDQVEELQKVQTALDASNSFLAKVREHLGIEANESIESALSALKHNAELGTQYAAKVIEEACGAGVRAMGEAFNVESMKLAFSHLPVGEVEKIRDTYNAQAKNALGGGGLHVSTEGKTLPDDPTRNANGSGELNADEKREQAKKDAQEALKRNGYGHLLKEAK